MILALALGCGLLVGMCLGALGGGGSILIAPALLLGLHLDPLQATFVSKAVVGLTSFVAAVLYWRQDAFDLRAAFVMAAAGLAPAYYGSRLTPLLPAPVIIGALAVVMFAAAGCTYYRAAEQRRSLALVGGHSTAAGVYSPFDSTWMLAAAGAGVGFFTGLLGVGCGFLIVPTLLMAGLPMRAAAGTSLVVICLNSAVACLAGWHSGFPINTTALFGAAAILACPVGVRIAHRVSPADLQNAFATLVALAGVVMVLHAVTSLT
jgi:uncharacterized membrane protein YfcA